MVAKFYDNYHQPDGAASSLSHGVTPSIRNLLPNVKKPYKKFPLNIRYALLFDATFIGAEVQTTITHM